MRRLPEYSVLVLLLLPVAASQATAQTTGTCPRSLGEAYLDVGNVRARIFNNGALFYNFYRGGLPMYEVPKGSGIHALFNSGIWLGGLVHDELRMSGWYGDWEFWAGPLDEQANPPVDCARYDRLYSIYRDDIVAYNATGKASSDLADWPVELGAPVVDGDGVDGNYNLEGGDRPALLGDQMVWWVMNDVGNVHRASDAPPMVMEIHATAFAFQQPRSPIGNTTFYRYVLRYKGHHPLEEAYFGIFSDPALGNYDDDYVGSDTTLHLGYSYNADNFDERNHIYGPYGVAPPAIGYTFLRSAVAPDGDGRDNDRDDVTDEPGEMLGMTSFLYTPSDPAPGRLIYFHMQARWRSGRHMTFGGNGRDFTDIPTNYLFSGDPVTGQGWSEINPAGDGSQPPVDPSDRWFLISSGPFTMQPGDEQEILFAIVWSRGHDHLDSVRQLKIDVKRLHEVADDILQVDVPLPEPPPVPTYGLGFVQNYPNPFSTATTIRYSLPQAMRVRLRVFDVLGRTVATLVDERQDGGIYEVPFEADDLPAGVYVYRIEMDHLTFTRRMALVR